MTLHPRILSVVCALALTACAGEPSDEGEVADPQQTELDEVATDEAALTDVGATATYRRANLTNFESYPDPDSEECREYNGCTWAGYFAFVNGRKPESWVRSHNIIAVHSRDANRYRLKTFRLKKNGRTIDAKVYDMCSDSDCNGCCTRNARSTGFLIDIEKYTMQRFGSGSGIVEWTCLDC
jgi:hypothetical protein